MKVIETVTDGVVGGYFDFTEEIERGAALLDKYSPDWVENINLAKLDLSRPHTCVLGQAALHAMLAPAVETAMQKVMSHGYDIRDYRTLSVALIEVMGCDDGIHLLNTDEPMVAHGFLFDIESLPELYENDFTWNDEMVIPLGEGEWALAAEDALNGDVSGYDMLTEQWKDYIAARLNRRRENLNTLLDLDLINNLPAQPVLA